MRIPPVVWTVSWLGVQRVLTRMAGGRRRSVTSTIVGGSLVAVGLSVAAEATRELATHDTSVDPRHPEQAKVLVTSGIFERTRNPIYLGMVGILAGAALISGRKRNLITVPAAMLAMMPQINSEEISLIDKFGVDFIEYQQRTPRWL